MRLSEIVSLVDAAIHFPEHFKPDADIQIRGAFPVHESGSDHITMIDSVRRLGSISAAAAVVTPVAIQKCSFPQLVVADPHAAFGIIVAKFRPPLDGQILKPGIDPSAKVHPSAVIHPSATIGPDVVVGPGTRIMPGVTVMARVRIGSNCLLSPSVTIYPHSQIGDRVTMHASVVIGAHGFGYRRVGDRHEPTCQNGFVVIEDDVELGACVTIDRGTFGTTRIGAGTKIDNQVMIAHNCQIGRRNLICSQVGVAGSCTTGDDVILAGQVGLKDHIRLGDRAIVGAQAGVMEDLPGDEVYFGSPATTQRDQMKIMAVERRLPELRRDLKTLRRTVKGIQAQILGQQVDAPESTGSGQLSGGDSAQSKSDSAQSKSSRRAA